MRVTIIFCHIVFFVSSFCVRALNILIKTYRTVLETLMSIKGYLHLKMIADPHPINKSSSKIKSK